MKDNNAPKTIKRADYTPPPYWLDATSLLFVLDEDSTLVTNTMTLRRNTPVENGVLELDGVDLELLSVQLNGSELTDAEFSVTEDQLIVTELPPQCELRIVTRIYPDRNTALEGLYRSSGNYCTQCEAQGFRKITYYPDRPDVLTKFHVRIEAAADQYPELLSNGNKLSEGLLEGGRHFVEWTDPFPKPSYLFALVAGKLESLVDTFTTRSGRDVELVIYVESHNLHKCDYAMQALKKSMRWDEEVFGLEYDLDIFMIVAVDDFNMGAMENKGLNIFNSRYVLADQSTATDSDFKGVEAVIAHEYFHNWTGNRVTCRDWFQLSLKEGLTVFRDQEFSADMNSRAVKRIEDVRLLRTRQFPEDAGPMAHPIRPDAYMEINNFYTVTVYEKGAEVIRMMHTLLGADGFRTGMDLYFERFDGQAVTCDDFVQSMQDASGVDLDQFRRWYSQAGTPLLEVTGRYDDARREYVLVVRQSCPATAGQDSKSPFHIPVTVALLNAAGDAVKLKCDHLSSQSYSDDKSELTLNITEAEQSFVFRDIDSAPVPSLLRNFSAPVKVDFDYSDRELAHLMAHDSDSFNQWDAGQRLYTRVLESLMDKPDFSADDAAFGDFFLAWETLIHTESIDPALLAAALTFPGVETVAESHAIIRVDDIDRAIRTLKQELVRRHHQRLMQLVTSNCEEGSFKVDSIAIGRRSLKNTCLQLLGHATPDYWLESVTQQLETANNMTDKMSALVILCHSDEPERESALSEFYATWANDRLVIDKWFSLQALSARKTVIDEVIALTGHPAFDLGNPNRVRALLGAFIGSNTVGFHHADGAGYQLAADHVLKLDQTNPQVAARLVGPLGRWQRFDACRAGLMQKQLHRIVSTQNLSPDVFEIVSRSLEQELSH